MKTTPFTDIHIQLGAKMSEFAGYNMPISYGKITDEHLAVRENVGLFDVSHMGEFIIKGKEALELLQKVSSNDVAKLYPGKVQYSCLTNYEGGIIDDMLLYLLPDGTYLMVVNASNIEKDWQWINDQNTFDAELINISDRTGLLAVQGPNALKVLQEHTDMDLSDMPYYTCKKGVFAGVDKVLISTTGYTGAGGFEVYFYNEHGLKIWEAITKSGQAIGLQPIGLAARDTLRLEMGYCLYGNDINDTTNPLEAGLGWITKFNKDFIGKDTILAQKEKGLHRKLVGFEIEGKGIARHDYAVVDEQGNTIGKVTSGTQSPSTKKAIGMAYVNKAYSKINSTIFIQVRKKQLKATVVKTPFI